MVNAQVTAMVSLLELSSNVTYIIIVYFTVKTSYTTLIQIMILYMILLPYSFLMNTSHNKNRIVEYGWSNVIKNVLMKQKNAVNNADDIRDNANSRIQSISHKLQHKVLDGFDSKRVANIARRCDISQNFAMENIKNLRVGMINEPCSSKGTSVPMALNARNLKTVDNVPTVMSVEQGLVTNMRDHIDDELKYLQLFKKFVSFQDHCEKGKNVSQFQAENEIQCYTTTKGKAKNSNSFQRNKNRIHQNKSKSFNTSIDYLSLDVDFIDRESNLTLSENQRNRMEQRAHLLSRLQMYSRRNSTYDSYKDKLIDLEENFMNANE